MFLEFFLESIDFTFTVDEVYPIYNDFNSFNQKILNVKVGKEQETQFNLLTSQIAAGYHINFSRRERTEIFGFVWRELK